MTKTSQKLVRWVPRVAGILVPAFLAVFALDAFDHGSFIEALPAFAVHLLPSFLVLSVVALAWRFEWVGAVGFVALAIAYAAMVRGRLDWIATMSLPLLIVGLLFFASWRRRVHVVH